MIEIPSWLFGVPPTSENLAACRTPGLIQAAVTTYPNPGAYQQQTGYTVQEGPPKWWSNPSSNPGIGYAQLTGTTHTAGNMSTFENSMYSQNVRNFYAERPTLLVPTIAYSGDVSVYEWRRLSFAEGVDDPAEFPLGIIWDMNPQRPVHAFPTDIVLFMLGGKPCAAKLGEALVLFPMKPQMPVGPGAATGGYSAAEVVKLAIRMNSGAAARMAAKAITDGPGDDTAKAERLVRL